VAHQATSLPALGSVTQNAASPPSRNRNDEFLFAHRRGNLGSVNASSFALRQSFNGPRADSSHVQFDPIHHHVGSIDGEIQVKLLGSVSKSACDQFQQRASAFAQNFGQFFEHAAHQ
jgi:hypothetical protein